MEKTCKMPMRDSKGRFVKKDANCTKRCKANSNPAEKKKGCGEKEDRISKMLGYLLREGYVCTLEYTKGEAYPYSATFSRGCKIEGETRDLVVHCIGEEVVDAFCGAIIEACDFDVDFKKMQASGMLKDLIREIEGRNAKKPVKGKKGTKKNGKR